MSWIVETAAYAPTIASIVYAPAVNFLNPAWLGLPFHPIRNVTAWPGAIDRPSIRERNFDERQTMVEPESTEIPLLCDGLFGNILPGRRLRDRPARLQDFGRTGSASIRWVGLPDDPWRMLGRHGEIRPFHGNGGRLIGGQDHTSVEQLSRPRFARYC